MISVFHGYRLNLVKFPERTEAAFVAGLIAGAHQARYPADYGVVMDFSRTRRIELPVQRLIQLAMERRAALPAEPLRPARSAAVWANDAVKETLETWEAFFHEPDRPALEFERFDDLPAALSWLGAGDALDTVRAALRD